MMPRCRAVALLLLAAARADDRTCAAPGNCDASVLDLPLFADRRHSLAGDALADTDWVSLGQRALEAGDARAAVQLMAAATKKLPFAGVVWQNLGVLLLDAAGGDAAEARVGCEARAALELAGLLGAPADAPDAAAAAERCPRRDWASELMRLRHLDAVRLLCFDGGGNATVSVDATDWERRRGVPGAATALRAFALMRVCGVVAARGAVRDPETLRGAVDALWTRVGAPAAARAAVAATGHVETERVAARDFAVPARRFELKLPCLAEPFRAAALDDFLLYLAKLFVAGNAIALDTCSAVISFPGCGAGHWHQDVEDPYQYAHAFVGGAHPPPPAVVAAAPLVDVDARNGPTAFLVGSHAQPDREREWWKNAHARGEVGAFEAVPAVDAGTALIFDVRLRHRGGPNLSGEPRPLLYAGYAQRWFRDAANFRSPRASEWASEASRTARAVLDRHGADAYVHALEERLGSEAVADVRLDEETAAALRARDSAAFYGV